MGFARSSPDEMSILGIFSAPSLKPLWRTAAAAAVDRRYFRLNLAGAGALEIGAGCRLYAFVAASAVILCLSIAPIKSETISEFLLSLSAIVILDNFAFQVQ